MDPEVILLADAPGFLDAAAAWAYAEWKPYQPALTRSGARAVLAQCLNRDRLPLALVAIAGEQALGAACLLDPPSFGALRALPGANRPGPWLAFLAASPDAPAAAPAALARAAVQTARALGLPELLLWTDSEKAWYERLGWELVDTTIYGRRYIDVLRAPRAGGA